MTKSIFVHCSTKFHRNEPFLGQRWNEAFAAFSRIGQDLGFEVYFSRAPFYNQQNKELRRAWVYDGKWKKTRNKKVDLLYFRGKNVETVPTKIQEFSERVKNLPIINNLKLESICDDKLLTHSIFPQIMPKTFLVNSSYEVHRVLNHLPSDYIVLKPRYGSFGKGVLILHKKEFLNGVSKDMILQEFVDTSGGIFGIKRVHDFRTILINGKIDHCYLRIPKRGSLLCNSTAGGKKILIDPEILPSRIIRRLKMIDSHFKCYGPRVYSIDMMQEPDKRLWLLEMNSKPGVYYYEGLKDIRKNFYKNIFRMLDRIE